MDELRWIKLIDKDGDHQMINVSHITRVEMSKLPLDNETIYSYRIYILDQSEVRINRADYLDLTTYLIGGECSDLTSKENSDFKQTYGADQNEEGER